MDKGKVMSPKQDIMIRLGGFGLAIVIAFVIWTNSNDKTNGVRPDFISSKWCVVEKQKADWGDDYLLMSLSKVGMFDPSAKVMKFRSTASVLPLKFFTEFFVPDDVSLNKPQGIFGSANSNLTFEPRVKVLQKGNHCQLP